MTAAPAQGAARTMLARAKVNYALHVTGQRDDGYHLLESLVAFPQAGDRLTLETGGPGTGTPPDGSGPGLCVSGPFAEGLDGAGTDDNLVLRAARAFLSRASEDDAPALSFHLDKTLPVASGIGGGSADAAAALTLLDQAFPGRLTPAELGGIAETLGADVPMCLEGRPALVSGIGEAVSPLAALPGHALVLVNPGVPVATPAVFRALSRRDNPPLPPLPGTGLATLDALTGWLAATRNDLEAPAIAVCPQIEGVLAALRDQDGVLLARMSGSGATCFAILEDLAGARALANRLAIARPGWWIEAAEVAPVEAPAT
ncbi:MAG: 4-(cytidine 5'-diphospho)-2-C-methyl-D-erythritol kinase [Stappia sp.]|uniref:4-(cytidine 5'-diphospho)-2-C-methyl-D-erythritol kinase n=1 Tax=Stappia sp. TaxID=1870903 RepID=UPI000C4F393C|nr:4-(cytidine 5'-diphospho)-2-C-methyl-D-erythritol kinase [Stappia sp.]MAB00398.1 4-(cytidine 5'-diphospho)-2-C-methyl-D-erythritol kinase [Stappia sp.]MBM19813.1 4-(cytidine 5'-diphospho)-2-C-methyl-D-erythritol kinase [Stappia sp.]